MFHVKHYLKGGEIMVEKGNIKIKRDKDDKIHITVNLFDFVEFCLDVINYIEFIEEVFVEHDKVVINIHIIFDKVGSTLLTKIFLKNKNVSHETLKEKVVGFNEKTKAIKTRYKKII